MEVKVGQKRVEASAFSKHIITAQLTPWNERVK